MKLKIRVKVASEIARAKGNIRFLWHYLDNVATDQEKGSPEFTSGFAARIEMNHRVVRKLTLYINQFNK